MNLLVDAWRKTLITPTLRVFLSGRDFSNVMSCPGISRRYAELSQKQSPKMLYFKPHIVHIQETGFSQVTYVLRHTPYVYSYAPMFALLVEREFLAFSLGTY
jgi:hypothetical protein